MTYPDSGNRAEHGVKIGLSSFDSIFQCNEDGSSRAIVVFGFSDKKEKEGLNHHPQIESRLVENQVKGLLLKTICDT